MEGQKDADNSANTSIEKTDTVQANSDLVSEIGQPSVTQTKSNRQTVHETEHTIVLHTRSENDSIVLLENEMNSGTDPLQNIEDYDLPEIPGQDNSMHSGIHLLITNLAVYSAKLIILYELFYYS